MNTQQYKLIDAPVPVKTIKTPENVLRHLTAIEKKAIRAGMNQGVACFKSGRKIYTISHIDANHYCVEIEEKETTIFNRLETRIRKVPFFVRLEKAKDEVKEKSIEQIEAEQLELMLTQEKSIETKEETQEVIDNPVVETVKETNPQNKVAKLQAKLTRLNAQLSITRGNRAKVKIVIEILRVESAIEQFSPKQKEITLTWEQKKSLNALTGGNLPVFSKLTEESKEKLLKIVDELEVLNCEADQDNATGKGAWKRPSEASIKRSEKRSNEYSLLRKRIEQLELIQEKSVEINQSKPVDVSATKKNEFCKKPEKATIKFLESRFKDAQVDITKTQVIIKSGTSELAMNLFFEIPDINDYYNQYRRAKTIKNLKQNQTSKVHSVCEYISTILLAS